jgi:uncharacterized transporter YbjL
MRSNHSINNLIERTNFLEKFIIIITIPFMLFEMALCIFELVFYFSNAAKYSNECSDLYWAITISMISPMVTSIMVIYSAKDLITNRSLHIENIRKNVIDYIKWAYVLQILNIIGAIWIIVIYFSISQECLDFWKEKSIMALILLDINFYFFWINISFMILIAVKLFYDFIYEQYWSREHILLP